MDEEARFTIEELKAQVASLRSNLEHTSGLAVACQVALTATLRSWGRPAEQVAAEIDRVMDMTAASLAQQGASDQFMADFREVRRVLSTSVHHAALDLADQ
ncbi:hypothetical protein [Stenotrophomonas maltophilia]|uniref:hypothetical protein n=1 Tax=Stenotrophomonas maltophilia TaxID=40324 RepID=UPI0013DD44B1|nr:hypothetical protein [Stenotrophomonas maltophilia]